MKKAILLMGLIMFFPALVSAQDKVDAPIWNVGDKWILTDGQIEVVDVNENGYVVQLPHIVQIFDKSNLNIIYVVEGDKHKKYKGVRKRLFNFPIRIGKTWEDGFTSRTAGRKVASREHHYFEKFTVLGWEEVAVKGGKYRSIKLEYYQKVIDISEEGRRWYWYSPDVKYLVKCEFEKKPIWVGFNDWELTSFRVKK